MAGGSNQAGGSVSSKISLIMLAISEGSRTLTEIAALSGIPLSTVHRLATELAAWGVLERTPDGWFGAGRLLRDIGRTDVTSSSGSWNDDDASFRDTVLPVMEDLLRTVGARVRVGYFEGELELTYIEKDSLYHPLSRAGPAARLPAHATALGKALLAFSPPRVIDLLLARGLRQYTPFTLTSRERLSRALKTIRATRLAVCDRELEPDSCGMAAPVFGAGGQVIAAIELHANDLATAVPAWRPVLIVAASSLSRELGRHPKIGSPAARPLLTCSSRMGGMVVDGA